MAKPGFSAPLEQVAEGAGARPAGGEHLLAEAADHHLRRARHGHRRVRGRRRPSARSRGSPRSGRLRSGGGAGSAAARPGSSRPCSGPASSGLALAREAAPARGRRRSSPRSRPRRGPPPVVMLRRLLKPSQLVLAVNSGNSRKIGRQLGRHQLAAGARPLVDLVGDARAAARPSPRWRWGPTAVRVGLARRRADRLLQEGVLVDQQVAGRLVGHRGGADGEDGAAPVVLGEAQQHRREVGVAREQDELVEPRGVARACRGCPSPCGCRRWSCRRW